ncbi:MAG: hypothetical protein DMF08_08900 [Verrucomicrobia bacterium]|nr:MAG: hypothetical protein DMF08_08900 [Verrucomicrobiota bacterium]
MFEPSQLAVRSLAIRRLKRAPDFLAVALDTGIINAVRVMVETFADFLKCAGSTLCCSHLLNVEWIKSGVQTNVSMSIRFGLMLIDNNVGRLAQW